MTRIASARLFFSVGLIVAVVALIAGMNSFISMEGVSWIVGFIIFFMIIGRIQISKDN